MEISGYRILDKIADGGMATVYLAEKSDTQEQVALKVLLPEFVDDMSVVQRFLDEGQIVAQLKHPAIVSVLDTGLSNGQAYMAMEYMPGGNLREKIQSGLTETDILQIVTRIVEALRHAHLKGILHLDVCPKNILFRNNGDPVLADFGISRKYLELDFDNPGIVMGNPRYMSPEQIKGERTDPKTDLYSLGVIFYEMLAGRLPYEAETGAKTARMHLYEVPEPLPAHYSHYQTLIDQLLEKIPERRFHSTDEVLNALGELHSSVSVLDDKTLIYPLKQTASGNMNHGSQQAATVIQDEEFFEYDDIQIDENFADQTDPLPVEEVLETKQDSVVKGNRLEEIADQFKPPEETPAEETLLQETPVEEMSAEEMPVEETPVEETPVEETPVEETQAEDEDSVRLVTLKTEQPHSTDTPASTKAQEALLEIEPGYASDEGAITGEFDIDPGALIAVRDDLSATPLAEKRFSLLNVIIILALFSAAMWLWSVYRENNSQSGSLQQPSSEGRHDPAEATGTPETERSQSFPRAYGEVKRPENNVDRMDANRQSATKSDVSLEESARAVQNIVPKASQPATEANPAKEIPGSIATARKSVLDEDGGVANIPLTEIVLEPDTGIELSDDQFIISYRLENTLKNHTVKLQREFDGSIKLFLDQPEIYEDRSRAISRVGLNLLSRLTYVFRNNQDFMVLVTDRSTGIDTPDSYRISAASANHIRDFLISQGLSAKRVRSAANSHQYRGNFSGIEIQLVPDLQAMISKELLKNSEVPATGELSPKPITSGN